jgi:AcrR family transcriptional regulator
MKKRRYTQKQRAAQRQATRDKIVEAAMFLHEELGPANTSIKAVAERAGVQRLTVYRHFPDDASLFQACTAHWLSRHPPPALQAWAKVEQADERTRQALLAIYRYYRRTRRMWRRAYQDLDRVPALAKPMASVESYLDRVRDDLVEVWRPDKRTRKAMRASLRHALRFSTWRSLESDKLSDKLKVELVMNWICGVQLCPSR